MVDFPASHSFVFGGVKLQPHAEKGHEPRKLPDHVFCSLGQVLKGGPLLVINGVITPRNSLVNG